MPPGNADAADPVAAPSHPHSPVPTTEDDPVKRFAALVTAMSVLTIGVACGEDDDSASPDAPSTDTGEPAGSGPSGGAERPSTDELVDYFSAEADAAGAEEAALIECFARAYNESEISDEGLRAMIDEGPDWTPQGDDIQATLDAATVMYENCLPER